VIGMAHTSEEQKNAAKKATRARSAVAGKAIKATSVKTGKTTRSSGAVTAKKAQSKKATSPDANVRLFAQHLFSRLPRPVVLGMSDADLEALAEESAGLLTSKLTPAGNALAARIGPTYHAEQLARYLPGVDAKAITEEAVRKRAKQHQLVGFLSADRVWLFPQWQFTTAIGRLEPIADVISAWADLPHDGVLAEVDLVAWMATRRRDLDGSAPAQWAAERGYDDRLRRAVRSVRRRAA
jgi:hypothetical protein